VKLVTVTIELPPEIEAGLLEQAQAEGLDVNHFVQNLVRNRIATSTMITPSGPDELSPEEWVRELNAWSQSHAHDNLPVLSDEAISREWIYEDRGL
jgi:hypothetical protein